MFWLTVMVTVMRTDERGCPCAGQRRQQVSGSTKSPNGDPALGLGSDAGDT